MIEVDKTLNFLLACILHKNPGKKRNKKGAQERSTIRSAVQTSHGCLWSLITVRARAQHAVQLEQLFTPRTQLTVQLEQLFTPRAQITVQIEQLFIPRAQLTVQLEQLFTPRTKNIVELEQLFTPRAQITVQIEQLFIPRAQNAVQLEQLFTPRMLHSHKEPIADQGQAESKSFNQSKNQSQISEVYSTKSKDTRIV